MQIKIAKPTRIILIVSFGAICIAEFVQLNLGETAALWWHVRHGFIETCCGVEVRVPLMYFGTEGGKESLLFITTPGYLRWRLFHAPNGMIRIAKNSTALDEEHLRQGADRMIKAWGTRGYQLREQRTVQMAGSYLTCSDLHAESIDTVGPDDQILCIGSGKSAYFAGSPALRDEFYSTVSTARVASP